ncbi:MAG: septum formation protein Maf [Magnetococcales bacterium]|nr:septum formation protein Maf [Magnetococcales bacterium]
MDQLHTPSDEEVLPWLKPGLRLRLASASPRRLALLQQVGITPEVVPAQVDERWQPGESVAAYTLRLAADKAQAVMQPGLDLCLGSDTAIALDGEAIGKPVDENDARRTLARLAGRRHEVITGIAVIRGRDGVRQQTTVTSRVTFRDLSTAEIQRYVASGEPMDKAGSYAIQGLGAFMIAHHEGSCSSTIGLPLFETLGLISWALQHP